MRNPFVFFPMMPRRPAARQKQRWSEPSVQIQNDKIGGARVSSYRAKPRSSCAKKVISLLIITVILCPGLPADRRAEITQPHSLVLFSVHVVRVLNKDENNCRMPCCVVSQQMYWSMWSGEAEDLKISSDNKVHIPSTASGTAFF